LDAVLAGVLEGRGGGGKKEREVRRRGGGRRKEVGRGALSLQNEDQHHRMVGKH